MYPTPSLTQAPGTSYNLEFLSPTFKTLSQQPAVRADYQFSSGLRITTKYTGQRGFKGTTPGTIPGFNDTYNAYPWVHAFATTVNYTMNPTTFLEGTYGFSNRRLGGVINSDFTNPANTGLAGLPSLFPNAYLLPDGSYNQRVMQDVAPPFFSTVRDAAPTSMETASARRRRPRVSSISQHQSTQDVSSTGKGAQITRRNTVL